MMACRYTSLWLALEVTGDDDWFQFLEAGERSAIFFFFFLCVFLNFYGKNYGFDNGVLVFNP